MSFSRDEPRLELFANGVKVGSKFYPFTSKSLSNNTTILEAPRNSRLYVHHVNMTVRTIAADTTTVVYTDGSKKDNVTVYLGHLDVVPGVAQTTSREFSINLLLDRGSQVYATYDNIPTMFRCRVVYATIDEVNL